MILFQVVNKLTAFSLFQAVADWVSKNDDVVCTLPIYVGGFSLLAVLFNRAVSGIAPVADASSSQSRADLLTLGLVVTNILAGLVWPFSELCSY